MAGSISLKDKGTWGLLTQVREALSGKPGSYDLALAPIGFHRCSLPP